MWLGHMEVWWHKANWADQANLAGNYYLEKPRMVPLFWTWDDSAHGFKAIVWCHRLPLLWTWNDYGF